MHDEQSKLGNQGLFFLILNFMTIEFIQVHGSVLYFSELVHFWITSR